MNELSVGGPSTDTYGPRPRVAAGTGRPTGTECSADHSEWTCPEGYPLPNSDH